MESGLRPFRSDELASFLNIPDFYQFPEWMGEADRVKLLGQGIDGTVVKAIGIETAVAYMGNRIRSWKADDSTLYPYPTTEENGQYAFSF